MRRVKAASLSPHLVSRGPALKEAAVKAGDITAELALRPEHPLALHARIAEEFNAPPSESSSSWLAKARALFRVPSDVPS